MTTGIAVYITTSAPSRARTTENQPRCQLSYLDLIQEVACDVGEPTDVPGERSVPRLGVTGLAAETTCPTDSRNPVTVYHL